MTIINMQKGKLSRAVSLALFSAGASIGTMSPAFAQEAAEETETIVVTGSRIQRSTAATPTPTTVLDAAQIEQLGYNNAGDILNSLPAFSGSVGRRNSIARDSGLELPNLRGMGTNRTLVLVNGRRHVGSQAGNSAVDVSTIPAQMIDRVEVITGAASAVYGADAVSGVVNFIMKQSFDGVKFDARYGESAEGDGEETIFSMLAGTEFNQGKGNLLFSFDYTDRKQVRNEDRDYASRGLYWQPNPLNSGLNDGQYGSYLIENRRVLPLNTAGIVSPTGFGFLFFDPVVGPVLGYQPIGELPAQTFDADGNLIPFERGADCIRINCSGGSGFGTDAYDVISVPTERMIASIVANYELSDDHRIFADIKYSNTTGENTSQPSFSDGVFGPVIQVGIENPYLPEEIRNAMDGAGLQQVVVHKAHDDLGKMPTENEFDVYQLVFGASGYLTEDISYDFYVQHGQSKGKNAQLDRFVDRFVQSQDAVLDSNGNIVCRDSSGGCVPLNPFGVDAASPEAVNYLMRPTVTDTKLEQTVVNFSINGDITELPAGTLQFAAGLEYREEKSESIPEDILLVGGETNNTWDGPRVIVKGSYDVAEIFGELRVPLLANKTLVEELTLETAVRFSDYSTVGEQTAYKFGLDWVVNESIRFRSSYGLAVRAPNAGELFTPENLEFQRVNDPCDPSQINLGINPSLRKSNCEALGMPENFGSLANGATMKILVRGNEDLDPEESTSTTVGFVYTPKWADNLSIGVDYWEMRIEEAITAPSGSNIIANCVDFDMEGNPFCPLTTRTEDFQIGTISSQIINVSELEASGYDVEANYQLDMGESGSILLNLVGSHYKKRDQVIDRNNPNDIVKQVGIANAPRNRFNANVTYRLEDWTAHLSLNYLGSSRISYGNPDDSDPIYDRANHIDSVIYANIRTAYRFDESLEIYLGVNNLMNKEPQAIPETYGGSSVYDAVGRSYYLGVNYEF
ncbi:TonB-dependent receptor plug domain-containing protein [Thalassotalea fusca]